MAANTGTSTTPKLKGYDTDSNMYKSVDEMWAAELADDAPPENKQWYTKAVDYWGSVESTENGMLGGLPETSKPDVKASFRFIDTFIAGDSPRCGHARALDCGAGIGRVTKYFLSKCFDRVDMVEQCPAFTARAREYVDSPVLGDVITSGLHTFNPPEATYDVIWCQWVLGHLTDDDLIAFFHRCRDALVPNGILVVKENNTSGKDGFVVDKIDSSVTRSDSYWKMIFNRAGMRLLDEADQDGFPKELFPVKMYALDFGGESE